MVTIRPAQIGDIPEIGSVLAVTWRDTYSSFLSESSIAKVTAEWHSPKVLEAEINSSSTFFGVAESSSKDIIGLVTAHSQEELLLIARLYVLPEFQRQGIGKGLIEASCRAFPQAQRVELDVEELNPKGRAFYRKLGFREVGVRTDDVASTKIDSVMLEKRIEKAA
jgi:ribosomal protein S18 acetylase RimI-like enzyme